MQIGIQNLFDPGSEMEKFESEIGDIHPGSATLLLIAASVSLSVL